MPCPKKSSCSGPTCATVAFTPYEPSYSRPCPFESPCKNSMRPKKGEPPCGCIYGLPCKAACYDWNPCKRALWKEKIHNFIQAILERRRRPEKILIRNSHLKQFRPKFLNLPLKNTNSKHLQDALLPFVLLSTLQTSVLSTQMSAFIMLCVCPGKTLQPICHLRTAVPLWWLLRPRQALWNFLSTLRNARKQARIKMWQQQNPQQEVPESLCP